VNVFQPILQPIVAGIRKDNLLPTSTLLDDALLQDTKQGLLLVIVFLAFHLFPNRIYSVFASLQTMFCPQIVVKVLQP
jgi:hypothetical protein